MMRCLALFVLVGSFLSLAGCGSQSQSNPGANVAGKWNVELTDSGQAGPTYTFGLSFTQNTTTLAGTEIAYTGGPVQNTGCIKYGSLTATGNTNGGSLITVVVSDPTTSSVITMNGTADSGVTEIDGTYNTNFGPNGSQPACANTTGAVRLRKQ